MSTKFSGLVNPQFWRVLILVVLVIHFCVTFWFCSAWSGRNNSIIFFTISQRKACVYCLPSSSGHCFCFPFLQLFVSLHVRMVVTALPLVTAPVHQSGKVADVKTVS